MVSPNSFLTMYSNTLGSMIPLSLTVDCNSPQPLPENLLDFSNMISTSPLPITPKLMDKLNEPIKKSKLISVSSAPIILTNGLSSLPLPNSSTTPFPIALQRYPPSLSSLDTILACTPSWQDVHPCPRKLPFLLRFSKEESFSST